MEAFENNLQQNDVILRIMELVLSMPGEQRVDLLDKLEQDSSSRLSLGDRDDSRKSFKRPISFYLQDRRYEAIGKDISSGGIFIETNEVFHLGQIVTLDIPFSNGDQSIQVPAEIVRVDSEGIGLKFLKKDKVTYK